MISGAHAAKANSFPAALATQCRVIGALMMRELHTRYGRENIGYLWMVGEPMLLASVIGALHAGNHTTFGSDMKPLPFAVLGYTTYIIFRGIVNRAEGSIEANAPLLYHRQVTILDIVVSRALIELAGVLITFFMLMALLIAAGYASMPVRPLALFAAWGLIFWYSLGHSLIITAISYENRTVGRLIHPYSYFMLPLSAAFFPVKWVPHPLREWLTCVPLASMFELARFGWFRSAETDYIFPQYMIGACMILTWIGLVLVSRMRTRIHLS